ncbi:MAG: GNAT family N-acetyltransferase [Candidatus Latescibacteria bacterium]|nr:GNAT family N-acetyltransferase [Candidatus Latescibacterota bacterium]
MQLRSTATNNERICAMSQEFREKYEITPLTQAQLPQVARILARAFHEDPIAQYMIPDEEERVQRMPGVFATFATYALLAGQVWTTAAAAKGVALCFPPAHTEMVPDHMAAAGFEELPAKIGEGATGRMFQVLDHIEQFHKRDMPEPHWYLMLLGVEPDQQGRGIGTSLVRKVLERADQDGVPCYLETANPQNVSFYGHLGFEVVVEDVEPESGVRFSTFKRA